MLSPPFSLPASPPSSPAQLSQLANDPPNNQKTSHRDGFIGTRYPSDSNHRFILIDQSVKRRSDNTMSLLESSVSTANGFRKCYTTESQHDVKDSCDSPSCSYADLYDADDELPEEDDDAEDHDIYFGDAAPTLSLNLGMPSSPLLVGDIPALGGSLLTSISPTTNQIPSSGCSADSLSASSPPAVPHQTSHGLSPFFFAIPGLNRTNAPPRLDLTDPMHGNDNNHNNNNHLHSPQPTPSPLPSSPPLLPTITTPIATPITTPITTPPTAPPTLHEISTLNAWFDLPSPTASTPSPTSAWYASSPWYTTTNDTTSSHTHTHTGSLYSYTGSLYSYTYTSDRTYYSDDSAYDEWSSSSPSSWEHGGDEEGGGWRGFSGFEVATAVVVVEMELEGLGEGEWRGLMMGGETDGEGEGDTDVDTDGERGAEIGSVSGSESDTESRSGSDGNSGESDGRD